MRPLFVTPLRPSVGLSVCQPVLLLPSTSTTPLPFTLRKTLMMAPFSPAHVKMERSHSPSASSSFAHVSSRGPCAVPRFL
jgi:hypothetical protein